LTDVDLARGRISFQVKGGGTHVTRLHPKLVPLFERLQREGRAATWQRPVGASRQWAAIRWNKFFDAIGLRKSLPNVCFHSLRVTAATAMARSKVPENLAKQFIGHASTTVHRGYLRLRAEDLSDCTQAIG
jgi:integrase